MSKSQTSILFVDDEHLICDIFSEYFELEGYKTFKAHSGEDALRFLRANHEQVDIIVTDIKMNNGDGLWLIDKLNEFGIKKELFIMTAHLEFKLEELQPLGVKWVFHKPAKFDMVQSKIESFL